MYQSSLIHALGHFVFCFNVSLIVIIKIFLIGLHCTFIFDIGSSEESDTNDLELLTRDKRDFDENQQNFRNKRLTTRRVGDVDVVVQGDLSYELI